MPNAAAEVKKSEGNNFFKNKQFAQAIHKYTEAIKIDGNNHTYWSNRSACHAGLDNWEESAKDARQTIIVNKKFIKGYFRLATALKNLNDLDGARETLQRGLVIEPMNSDLKSNMKDIDALIRGEKVAALISSAESQLKRQDYAAAVRTCDSIMRTDAGNPDAKRILSVAQPRFDAAEKKRKAGLGRVGLLKEEGDDAYRNAQFEVAVGKYSKCLDLISDKTSELAIKCLSNRGACYKQLSNFDGTVSDCTAVLEVDPNNVKSLIRRAQAFEAIERFRFALQDIRTVLALSPDVVGPTNLQIANGMQHRLNRVVQQLKQAG